jgi:cobalt-zinc-cadmium efflux system protein
MSHDHSHHTHHGHHGHHGRHTAFHRLAFGFSLVLVFAVIEAIAGYFSHSLALFSDAGHMLADGLSLGLACFAARIAQRPPSHKHSYGYVRAEVLSAGLSSLVLLGIAVFILVEGVERLRHPPTEIHSIAVMSVASLGIVVNISIAWLLSDHGHNLNTRAALLHVLSDLLASCAALIAGAIVYATGWTQIDPILSLLIGVIIVLSSLRLLRESLLILMEGVPAHISLREVSAHLQNCPGVRGVHDLHIWTLASGYIALSAHIDIHELGEWKNILSHLKHDLADEFNIIHVTLQPEAEIMDCKPCDSR